MSKSESKGNSRQPFVMAVVLGTAFSTIGAMPIEAASSACNDRETTLRAIHDLDRYCTACWRNARLPVTSWDDCTQEVFRRLLQNVPTSAWTGLLASDGPERKEFMRAIDAVKKRTQRSRKFTGTLDGVADPREIDRNGLDDDREIVRQVAEEVLTDRQQRILQLSLEGWTVQQIADELPLAPERVSDEKYKAIRKLRDHLADRTSPRG